MKSPRSPSNGFCPRCGAPFPVEFKGEWWETGLRCAECGVGGASQRFLGPSDEEAQHALGDWPLTDRTAVTSALVELDVAYRWEAGLVLVVPAAVDHHVRRLVDEVGGAATAAPLDDVDHGGDEDGSAQAAMAELFDAADRLARAPTDPSRAEAAIAAAAAVSSSSCPYGLESSQWREIQRLGSALAAELAAAAPEEVVAANASDLRQLLRNYV